MAVATQRQKKLIIQVNTGTTSSPTLKNRTCGTGYWINTNETKATDEKIRQLGVYFADLQTHTLNAVRVEEKYRVEAE